MHQSADEAVETLYRSDWGRIVAALIRLVGDFEVAEEAAQEAFTAGVDQWRISGVPEFPRAWIIKTARHKAIDLIRRRTRFNEKLNLYASELSQTMEEPDYDTNEFPDDRLRLIFTCCHPALALEAQVALTLRTLGGLETDEIARAFLVPPATIGAGSSTTVSASFTVNTVGTYYAHVYVDNFSVLNQSNSSNDIYHHSQAISVTVAQQPDLAIQM